jgi:hypothetical protein
MTRSLIIKLFPLALLLLVSACQSPLSEGKVNDLSAVDVRIEILQDLTDKKKNEVTVFLYDQDGKPIRNKSIKLKVNATDLAYKERQELYYTTTSKYSASDIPIEQVYNLQITLSNGKSYFLGCIKPLGESNENDILCNEKGDFDKDLMISWKGLKDINELSIRKSVLLSTSTNTQKNYDPEPTITKKIGSSGKYTISKAAYISSKSTISMVEFKFSALEFGTMNPQLLKGSEIKIFGHIDKIIDFDEDSKK